MIQRIQTVYLLAALVLTGLILFMPFAEIGAVDGSIYSFGSAGLSRLDGQDWLRVTGAIPLFVLILVTTSLLLASIFLFRNRRLQMRICIYSIILEFGLIGLGYYYFFLAFRDLQVSIYTFKLPVIIPVISIILIYLAFRAIRKDDILVRSLDRIR